MTALTHLPHIVCNSRHWAVMPWLHQHYPDAQVRYLPGAKASDLGPDTALISTYPLHVAAAAGDLINIEYPTRPPQAPDPDPNQMDQAQATPIHYRLIRSQHPHVPETYPDFCNWLTNQPIQDRVAVLADLIRRFG